MLARLETIIRGPKTVGNLPDFVVEKPGDSYLTAITKRATRNALDPNFDRTTRTLPGEPPFQLTKLTPVHEKVIVHLGPPLATRLLDASKAKVEVCPSPVIWQSSFMKSVDRFFAKPLPTAGQMIKAGINLRST